MYQSQFLNVLGHEIHYMEGGKEFAENGTIVFLHGFPEYWQTWQNQMDHLSKKYRVIAPDMLGYNLSAKPEDDSVFEVPNLIGFWRQFFMQINNGKPVYLVAHDWGGAIAWPFTAFNDDLVQKLVILNAGHPSTFTREMKSNPRQQEYSDYIHQLIADDAVEVLSEDNYAYLQRMVFEQTNVNAFTEQQKQGYLNAWSQPGAVEGMLRYYRSMPQLAAKTSGRQSGPEMNASDMKIPQIHIKVPTLVLWGMKDKAFVPEVAEGLEEYVENITVKRFEASSHWLQHEYPAEVSSAIAAFIR